MQGMENDELVEAIHEFRREFAASGFDSRALDLFVKSGGGLVVGLNESVAAAHEFGDFASAEVGGEEDDGLGEVHAAIVAEGQGGLVQHAEEQLPESVAGFFNFVEKQEGELELFGVRSGKRFLGDQRMSFAVAEIARGRTDQFGDFVGVLEFGAVDLDDQAWGANEDL